MRLMRREVKKLRGELTSNRTFAEKKKKKSRNWLKNTLTKFGGAHRVYARALDYPTFRNYVRASVVICTATYPQNTSCTLTFDNAISFPWKSLPLSFAPLSLFLSFLVGRRKRWPRLKSNSDGAAFSHRACRFPRPQTLFKRNFLSEKLTLPFCISAALFLSNTAK